MAWLQGPWLPKTLLILGICTWLTVLAGRHAGAAGIWTHVASACALDPASVARAKVQEARLQLKPGRTGTIIARCNVTNPLDDGQDPFWNFLDISYRDPDGQGTDDQVSARLYRVVNDTGEVTLVATFDSNSSAVKVAHIEGRFFLSVTDFDFEAFAYFIELRVQRAVARAGPAPMVALVRLRETK
jgi:hypothetical protein